MIGISSSGNIFAIAGQPARETGSLHSPGNTETTPSDTVALSTAGPTSPPRENEKIEPKVTYPEPNGGAGVFSEPFGKIKHLALQLDGDVEGVVRENVLGAWATLFKTMDPDVRFTIVLEGEKDKAAVEQMIREKEIPNPERFNFVLTSGINITLWSRDQMVGLFSPTDDTTLLAQTTMRPHGQDPLIPPLITAANKGIILDPDKRLVTDGGDEVSNSKETFLGYNSLYLTAKHLYEMNQQKRDFFGAAKAASPFRLNLVASFPEGGEGLRAPDFKYERNPLHVTRENFPNEQEYWMDQAQNLFEQKYGKRVEVIGADDPATPEIEQPATFHIDMGLTPVDDQTVLVGDPGMAIDIIRSLPKEEYDAYNKKLSAILEEPGDILQRVIDANTTQDPLLQHQFDYNAEHLKKKGYDVIRMPYLQGPRGITWFTYNNCLMESYKREDGSEVRRVFLPEFGLPALDRKAEEIYKSQGFQVVPLDLPALTAMRGAIRCISNILGRQPEA
ncbi:MAG: hypothetical protein HYU64_12050 [Armatimonadetes bacterium]|nr:hypothetical protein [Armatimonadota bacterium]